MMRDFIKAAGVDLPVGLLALAFFLTMLFQTVQLVREGEGVAVQVLISLGADLARLRQRVLQIASGDAGEK